MCVCSTVQRPVATAHAHKCMLNQEEEEEQEAEEVPAAEVVEELPLMSDTDMTQIMRVGCKPVCCDDCINAQARTAAHLSQHSFSIVCAANLIYI